jgi:hypothetical protein
VFPLNWFFYLTTEAGGLLINSVHTVLRLRIKKWILIEEKKVSYSEIKKGSEIPKVVESNCTSVISVRTIRICYTAVFNKPSQLLP